MVWLYQGLWCKLLGGAEHHSQIAAGVLPAFAAGPVLAGIGAGECALAVWVASGWRAPQAAVAQTALLAAMNAAGLLWARQWIADPAGMVLQNFAFLTLAWITAGRTYDAA